MTVLIRADWWSWCEFHFSLQVLTGRKKEEAEEEEVERIRSKSNRWITCAETSTKVIYPRIRWDATSTATPILCKDSLRFSAILCDSLRFSGSLWDSLGVSGLFWDGWETNFHFKLIRFIFIASWYATRRWISSARRCPSSRRIETFPKWPNTTTSTSSNTKAWRTWLTDLASIKLESFA